MDVGGSRERPCSINTLIPSRRCFLQRDGIPALMPRLCQQQHVEPVIDDSLANQCSFIADGAGIDRAQHDSVSINGRRVGKPSAV